MNALAPSAIRPAPTIDRSIEHDFARDVWCLFGLPVDRLSLDEARRQLVSGIRAGHRLTLSTLNVNWLVTAHLDAEFRAAVLDSDLCTLDGRPLLWLARAAGLPFDAVVAGSTLAEHLLREHDPGAPLRVFLFGGEPGVAARAGAVVNRRRGGLRVVGHLDPGRGEVEALSSAEALAAINRIEPEFLMLALGARKGQLWIARNRSRLRYGVVAHLGATFNFLAGVERRAPLVWQRAGLEWLWRVTRQPALWRRYGHDGRVLLRLIREHGLPVWRATRSVGAGVAGERAVARLEVLGDTRVLRFAGALNRHGAASLCTVLRDAVAAERDLVLDFAAVTDVDARFLGLLLLLLKHQRRIGRALRFRNLDPRLLRVLRHHCIDKSAAALGFSLPAGG